MAESIEPNQRGITFGLHRSMDNAGAVFGPLMAAFLLSIHIPLRDIFLWAIIPGVIAVVLALCLKEPPREQAVVQPFSWSLEGLPPQFKRYILVAGIFALANSSDTVSYTHLTLPTNREV